MSKQIKVGDIVRIFDGVGRGQKQVVRDLVDLPMGTGIVVMLDHGELEMLNPANVEVFSADGEPESDDQEEPSVFMPNADLIRRVKALEKNANHIEAHLQGHEKHAHEAIEEKLSDLTTLQLKDQAFLRYHLEEIYGRLGMIAPNDPPNDNLTDVTTENVAARTHWRDPESLLGRLHPSAWLKVSQNYERGDFVAVIHMVHPPDESTYHYGRGKTRSDAVRAAHDGLERVIATNKARDGEA